MPDSKNDIPAEFKKYFEPQFDPTKLLPPPKLMLPETAEEKYLNEHEIKPPAYHTYIFDDASIFKKIPATLGEWYSYPPAPVPSYTIHVYEDLTRPARPYAAKRTARCHDGSTRDDNVFEVHVPKREEDLAEPNDAGSLLASWLHEIGHIIAWIFKLPAAHNDPRCGMMPQINDVDAAIYRSEVEAWSIGEAIYRFSLHRQHCLNSYRDKSRDPWVEPTNP